MIAEYERAQIAERSRRGKRHRAQQGSINVLCGAPYGYRYIKKTDTSAAYYQVIEAEADVVRTIFDWCTRTGMSIGAVTRELNHLQIPTRSGNGRWERSTVWAILRNPAYAGRACFGKRERRERQRITRRMRLRGGLPPRQSAVGDRPRQEWVEIPVPALVSEETFALAQEQLQKNKQFASRRTIRPTLLQGLLACQQCGYPLSGASGGRKPNDILYYYRCIGSDSWRHLHDPVCQNRPLRQDYLDQLIWQEILRLVQDPTLMQNEIQRRMQEAEKADPLRQREQSLHREHARLENKIDRLLITYLEELITLEQLRQRMPELRQQQQAVRSELESLHMAAQDQSRYLRVVDTISDFRARLQGNAERLDLIGRRKIIRRLVKEILVSTDTITIRHSIPLANSPHLLTSPTPPPDRPPPNSNQSYRLCTRGSSRRAGQRLMQGLRNLLEGKLKLKVNRQKSAVARPWERKFLGFSFTNGTRPKRRIAPKAVLRFETRIRNFTRRTRGVTASVSMGISWQSVLVKVNGTLRRGSQFYLKCGMTSYAQ